MISGSFLNFNPKYLGVDEIEKAYTTTTYTLLSVIENGVVSKTLAGENIIKWVEPIIFASCNNLKKLSESLLSKISAYSNNYKIILSIDTEIYSYDFKDRRSGFSSEQNFFNPCAKYFTGVIENKNNDNQ